MLGGRTNRTASLRRSGEHDSRQHDGNREQKWDQEESHGRFVAPL
jgi:hypothetical protein